MKLNSYLFFNGQCQEAFRFYEQCLGGKIELMMTHESTPAAEHVPAEWRDKIIHARMTVEGEVLMGSDAPPGHYRQPQGYSVNIQIDDPVRGERIFNALAKDGKVQMPFQQTFWAHRFGMVTDRFGTSWMVNCETAA